MNDFVSRLILILICFLVQRIHLIVDASLHHCENGPAGNLSHFKNFEGENDEHYFPPGRFSAGSPPLLQLLAKKETKIFGLIKKFREATNNTKLLRETNEAIDSYVKNFEESGILNDFLRPQKISWNPIASYLLVQRFGVDLKNLLIHLSKNEESLELQTAILNVMNLEDDLGWPSDDDFGSTMDAIIRIQIVYNISAKKLAEGQLKTKNTATGLSPMDCHKIGKYLLDSGCCLSEAIQWFEVAGSEKLGSINCTSNFEKILTNDLTIARQKMGHLDTTSDQVQIKRSQFWRLCDGENYKNPSEETKNLFCWYETKETSIIDPVKIEMLSMDPVIVQFYDVISHKLMDNIRDHVTPQIVRSRVFDEDEEKEGREEGDVVNYRTSFTAWLSENFEKNNLKKIPKMIQRLTGLTVAKKGGAEKLQVAAYASGGHYEVHVDEVPQPSVRGGRVATFMIYLSEVEEGGFTAFPIVGVAARPVKGSAVFWFNLLSTGQLDERTEHGACPVIFGEKWVANKWILFDEQFNTHKCGLRPKSPLGFNGKFPLGI